MKPVSVRTDAWLFQLAIAFLALFCGLYAWAAPSSAKDAKEIEEKEQQVLSQIHAINQTEIRVGQLAEQKGQTTRTRNYGKELVADHSSADKQVLFVAQEEGVRLSSKEAAEQKKDEAKLMTKLNSSSGIKFDRTFSQEMDKAHHKAIVALKAYRKELAGTKTAALIDDILPSMQKHEVMAESIEKAE